MAAATKQTACKVTWRRATSGAECITCRADQKQTERERDAAVPRQPEPTHDQPTKPSQDPEPSQAYPGRAQANLGPKSSQAWSNPSQTRSNRSQPEPTQANLGPTQANPGPTQTDPVPAQAIPRPSQANAGPTKAQLQKLLTIPAFQDQPKLERSFVHQDQLEATARDAFTGGEQVFEARFWPDFRSQNKTARLAVKPTSSLKCNHAGLS